jgi:hypothetical protein
MGRTSGRTRMLLMSAGLVLALSLASCADETKAAAPEGPGIALSADKPSYSPGQQVKVTLTNTTQDGAGYNLCFAFLELQRQSGDNWETVRGADLSPPGSEVIACTTELRFLPPDQTVSGPAHLPADLPNGTYRLTHEVEVGNEIGENRQEIATEGFTVVR